MIRFLLVVVLLVAVAPFLFLAGFGLWQGYDVVAGWQALVKNRLRIDLEYTGEQIMAPADLPTHRYTTYWQGELDSELLSEASGLAPSLQRKDVYYSINDSGNEPRLFAVRNDGADIGSWPFSYSRYHDFEDIASFRRDDQDYLLLADTGDNLYWRPTVKLLVFEEPSLVSGATGAALLPQWTIELEYPDGPRDVEAVAVDVDADTVLLISKRRVPAEVYSVPLAPVGRVVTARLIAHLKGIPEPSARDLREDKWFGKYRSSPTGFDLSGRKAVVVTYRDAYLFTRKRRESWGQALAGVPDRILLPPVHGLESVSFDQRANSLFVTGEREDGVGRSGLFRVMLE